MKKISILEGRSALTIPNVEIYHIFKYMMVKGVL